MVQSVEDLSRYPIDRPDRWGDLSQMQRRCVRDIGEAISTGGERVGSTSRRRRARQGSARPVETFERCHTVEVRRVGGVDDESLNDRARTSRGWTDSVAAARDLDVGRVGQPVGDSLRRWVG